MIKKGLFPTSFEFSLLIQSLCQEEKIDEAERFMECCLNKRCAINVAYFTTVVHWFLLKR